jgi:hypothetical protein
MNRTSFLPVLAMTIAVAGCAQNESVPVGGTETSVFQLERRPKLEQPEELRAPLPEDSQPGSGEMTWAAEFKGQLIAGLDGSLYEPYRRAVIEQIQQSLILRGLYRGPVNGVLDLPTMKATYAFQKVNNHLQLSGVPSPRTRKVLQQGSHTDPSF